MAHWILSLHFVNGCDVRFVFVFPVNCATISTFRLLLLSPTLLSLLLMILMIRVILMTRVLTPPLFMLFLLLPTLSLALPPSKFLRASFPMLFYILFRQPRLAMILLLVKFSSLLVPLCVRAFGILLGARGVLPSPLAVAANILVFSFSFSFFCFSFPFSVVPSVSPLSAPFLSILLFVSAFVSFLSLPCVLVFV